MKPPHDMGGNPSEPIIPDKPDDPKFEKSWHRRVLGITIAMGAMGAWSIDASRYARESLPRSDYTKFSYYEKWLGGLTNLLFQKGFINKNKGGRVFDYLESFLVCIFFHIVYIHVYCCWGGRGTKNDKELTHF